MNHTKKLSYESVKQKLDRLDQIYSGEVEPLWGDIPAENKKEIFTTQERGVAASRGYSRTNKAGVIEKSPTSMVVKTKLPETKAEFLLYDARFMYENHRKDQVLDGIKRVALKAIPNLVGQGSEIKKSTKDSNFLSLIANNAEAASNAENISAMAAIGLGPEFKLDSYDPNRTYEIKDIYDLGKLGPFPKPSFAPSAQHLDPPLQPPLNLHTASLRTESFFENKGTFKMMALRSATDWSLGLDHTEQSIHNCYLHMIETAERFIYIENQYFISSTSSEPSLLKDIKNKIVKAIYARIKKAVHLNEDLKVYILIPALPGAEGNLQERAGKILQILMALQNFTIGEGDGSLIGRLLKITDDPYKYIMFASLRTYDFKPNYEEKPDNSGIYPEDRSQNPITELIYIHSKVRSADAAHDRRRLEDDRRQCEHQRQKHVGLSRLRAGCLHPRSLRLRCDLRRPDLRCEQVDI